MKLIHFLVIFFSFALSFQANALKCSTKGTNIYYVNGVFSNKKSAQETADNISRYVAEYPKSIDEKGVVDTYYILNPSYGILNDIFEGYVQNHRAEGKSGNPWLDVGMFLHGEGGLPPQLGVVRTSINALSLLILREKVSNAFTSKENLIKAEISVVDKVSTIVKESLDNKKKVIVIPHSQGNAVTNLAIKKLWEDPNYIPAYYENLGVLHVATPVNKRITNKNEAIKLNGDIVVSNPGMLAVSEFGNYIITNSKYDYSHFTSLSPGRMLIAASGLFREMYSKSNEFDPTNHFMSTYMSSNVKARSYDLPNSTPQTMKEIFKEKLASVANKLEDNCGFPEIDLEVEGATKDPLKDGYYIYNGYTNFYKHLTIKAVDKNPLRRETDTKIKMEYHLFQTDYINTEYDDHAPRTGGNIELNGINEVEGSNFSLQFANTDIPIVITASNLDGTKTIRKIFYVRTNLDHPPSISVFSSKCWLSISGQDNGRTYRTYTGMGEILFSASDDDSYEFFIEYMSSPYDKPPKLMKEGTPTRYQNRDWVLGRYFYQGETLQFYTSPDGPRVTMIAPNCNKGQRVYEDEGL